MREKSQLDDMRAALRGDLERARARREADPWRQQEAEPATEEPVRAESSDRLKPVTAGAAGADASAGEPIPEESIAEAEPAEGLTPQGSVPAETPEREPTLDPEPGQEEDTAQDAAEQFEAPPPATEPAAQSKSFFVRLFGRS
jgi:hypothetical protein